MRVRAVVVLAAMPLLLGAWTQSSENDTIWNPRGKAVVKTPDGVSHVARSSLCNLGPRAGRLRFGGKAANSDSCTVHRREQGAREIPLFSTSSTVL